MTDVLELAYRPPVRDRIVRKTLASHSPLTQKAFGNNDVIRFTVSPQREGLLLFEAHLHIRGALVKKERPTEKSTSTLANNALAALFDEARLKLNGQTVDETRHVAATTAMKTYVSFQREDAQTLLRPSAWSAPDWDNNWLTASPDGLFEGNLPLARLFGFCEDYRRAVFNATVDLHLVRARNDYNAIAAPTAGAEESVITLQEVELRIPQIIPDLAAQIKILRPTAANRAVPLYFRHWETVIVPSVERQTTHNINLGSFKKIPICALIGFQTDREHKHDKDASRFDHLSLRDISLDVDNERYPRQPLELDFATGRYTDALEMFAGFQQLYYQRETPHPLIVPDQFRTHAPIFVVDTSHHERQVVSVPVQIRLVFHTTSPVPDKTVAYVVLIFDAAYEYTPITRQLHQI